MPESEPPSSHPVLGEIPAIPEGFSTTEKPTEADTEIPQSDPAPKDRDLYALLRDTKGAIAQAKLPSGLQGTQPDEPPTDEHDVPPNSTADTADNGQNYCVEGAFQRPPVSERLITNVSRASLHRGLKSMAGK